MILGTGAFPATGLRMEMLQLLRNHLRLPALVLGCIIVAACARDPERLRTERLVSLVLAPQSCDVVPADPSHLRGAYLRSAGDFRNLEIVHIAGGEGKTALAPTTRIDEGNVRIPLTGEIGSLINSRPATATAVSALGASEFGPNAYVLAYDSDGLSYTGPVVVGLPPIGAAIPDGGNAVFSGQVAMTLQNGTAPPLDILAPAEMQVGYGSGAVTLRLQIPDAAAVEALGFAALEWTGLAICGQRIVSTGAGQLLGRSEAGGLAVPFGDVAAATSIRPQFEGMLYADIDKTKMPPGWAAGVLAIASDRASLSGVFLGQGQN